MTVSRIGLDWPAHTMTGWGNIAAGLYRHWGAMGIEVVQIETDREYDFPVFHALGNNMVGCSGFSSGHPDIAFAVFEDVGTAEAARRDAEGFDAIVTASVWNRDVLRRYGVESTLIHQGIDADLFQPAPKQRLFGERPTVFSGGKLEYRKGQDQVVAAFRKLLETEPDALLVTAWHNHWPIVPFTDSPHVDWTPGRTDLNLVNNWLEYHGIPERNRAVFGAIENCRLPDILHSCDVAVFPSRAEGGTNMCAMECMAAGIPTLISDSTGHKDLPSECCLRMLAVDDTPGHDGWKDMTSDGIGDLAAVMGAPIARSQLTGWTQQKYAADLLALIQQLTA